MLATAVGLVRGDGSRLNLALGFGLACVAMLVVSPVARGHYFMLLAPATFFMPLWLLLRGRPRSAKAMGVVLPVLSISHYVLLPFAGRIGLLGLGTAAWLIAAMVIVVFTSPTPSADSAARS